MIHFLIKAVFVRFFHDYGHIRVAIFVLGEQNQAGSGLAGSSGFAAYDLNILRRNRLIDKIVVRGLPGNIPLFAGRRVERSIVAVAADDIAEIIIL